MIKAQNFSEAKVYKGVGVVEIALNGDRIDDFSAFVRNLPSSFISLKSVKNEELTDINCTLVITERSGFSIPWEFSGVVISVGASLLVKYWDIIYEYVSFYKPE